MQERIEERVRGWITCRCGYTELHLRVLDPFFSETGSKEAVGCEERPGRGRTRARCSEADKLECENELAGDLHGEVFSGRVNGKCVGGYRHPSSKEA